MAARAAPLDQARFDRLIEALGPFESNPVIAAGVSGGADSMCLIHCLDGWARPRGGRAIALTVDHGLRPEAAAEAARVGTWMAARGIPHHVLRGSISGRGGMQAAARRLRYHLMTAWCREAGVLHLALAHHQADQAETFLLRLDRGSGLDGLAAMPVVGYSGGVRLLRPFLSTTPETLRDTLVAQEQAWLEDPSNRDRSFARTGMRVLLGKLPRATPARLAETAARLGAVRETADGALADMLARVAQIHPAGYCRIDGSGLAAAPEDLGEAALNRVLRTIGGGPYGPRRHSLTRLLNMIRGHGLAGGRTLGGCLVRPSPAGDLFVCREPSAVSETIGLAAGAEAIWDRRFRVRLAEYGKAEADQIRAVPAFTVAKLGAAGWRAIKNQLPDGGGQGLPVPVRYALPALFDLDGVVEVPHLDYRRNVPVAFGPGGLEAAFQPANPVAGARFVAPHMPVGGCDIDSFDGDASSGALV